MLQRPILALTALMSASTLAAWDPAPTEPKNPPQLVVQRGHRGELLYALALSSDGKLLASGGLSLQPRIHLWDTATGRLIRTLPGHGSRITGLAFNRDGQWLVSVGNDHEIRFWDVRSGKLLRTLKAGKNYVFGPMLFDNDRRMVTFEQHVTRIWDLTTDKELFALKDFGTSQAAIIGPEGKWILTGGHGNSARIYDLKTGEPIGFRFLQHGHWINSMVPSRDGKRILSGSEDKHVRLWDLESKKELLKIPAHAIVTSVAFNPDETKAYSAGTDGVVRVWNLADKKEITTFKHGGEIRKMILSRDGKRMATSCYDGVPRLWDTETGKVVQTFSAHSDPVLTIALSGDQKWLLSGGDDGKSRLWDLENGQQVRVLAGPAGPTRAVAICNDGQVIVTAGDDGIARLWNPMTGKEVRSFKLEKGKILSIAASPDGKQLLTGGNEGTAWLWDVQSGDKIRTFEGTQKEFRAVLFTSDGKHVLTAGNTNKVNLWDVQSGKTIREYAGYDLDGGYSSIAITPDGKRLAGGWYPYYWNVESGERLRMFKGHSNRSTAVSLSFDGKWVASGCTDGNARLWDVNQENPPIRAFPHDGEVTGVAFTRDGKRLFTSSKDDTIRLWETGTGKELCRLVSLRTGGWTVIDLDGRFDTDKVEDVLGIHWSANGKAIPLKNLAAKYHDQGLLAKKLGIHKEALREVKPIPVGGVE